MKKNLIFTTLLYFSALLLIVLIGYFTHKNNHLLRNEEKKSSRILINNADNISLTGRRKAVETFRIGLLIYNYLPAVETLISEFEEVFHSSTGSVCVVDVHSAEDNHIVLELMANKLLATTSYDLIWVIGSNAVQAIAHMAEKALPITPIMVSSCPWELLQKLEHECSHFHTYITGWGGSYDWKLRIDLMSKLIPNIKHALCLYSTSRDPSCLNGIESELSHRNISYKEIGIDNINTIFDYLRASLDGIDVIIVLRDSGIVPAMDKLIKLANIYHVPLYVSDIESLQRGASCSIYPNDKAYGDYCAYFAKKLLINKKKPSSIPFIHIKDWHVQVAINQEAIAIQNTNTPKNIQFLMGQSFIIKEKNV